jgi:hypothetical protein
MLPSVFHSSCFLSVLPSCLTACLLYVIRLVYFLSYCPVCLSACRPLFVLFTFCLTVLTSCLRACQVAFRLSFVLFTFCLICLRMPVMLPSVCQSSLSTFCHRSASLPAMLPSVFHSSCLLSVLLSCLSVCQPSLSTVLSIIVLPSKGRPSSKRISYAKTDDLQKICCVPL